jgi:hypothetical protein
MRKTALFAMTAVLILASLAYAAASSPSYVTAASSLDAWLPIVSVAIVLSISITAVYYLGGVVLHNNKIKASAVGELGQAIGAAIIMVAVLAAIVFFETGQFSLVSVVSPSSLGTLCGQLAGSNVILLNSQTSVGGEPTLTTAICGQVSDLAPGSGAAPDLTRNIDYGLLANYVIMANVTSQAADNLNSLYIFESWLGFMAHFNMTTSVCAGSCLIPLTAKVTVSSLPLFGYDKLGTFTNPMEFEANLTFYILFVQLLVIAVFLFAWPYLLAAGMILRASFFTRRLGGLLIAIGVVVVLIYPLMCALEYSASSTNQLSPIGASNLPVSATTLSTMAINEQRADGTNTIYGSSGMDFFVLPNAGEVVNYYGCMPLVSVPTGAVPVGALILPTGEVRYQNLLGAEAEFAAMYLIPGVGIGTALLSSAGGLVGALPYVPPLALGIVGNCTPDNAMSTVLALLNLYGVAFVTGIFLPLINILVALAATTSLSKLFGGDTDLMGISKLI